LGPTEIYFYGLYDAPISHRENYTFQLQGMKKWYAEFSGWGEGGMCACSCMYTQPNLSEITTITGRKSLDGIL
jgi:hypothetical protein